MRSRRGSQCRPGSGYHVATLCETEQYWGVELQLHAFLTSVLHGGEWSGSRPGRFTPGALYPLDRRLGGLQSRSGRGSEEKEIPSLPLTRIELRSSSPLRNRYSD